MEERRQNLRREEDRIMDRLDRLEARQEKFLDVINDLEKAVDRVSIILEQYKESKIDERIRQIELDMINEKMVSKAIQWLGVSIGGTAILLVASYLFGGMQ